MSHQQAGTGDASARMALMELAIGAMVGQAVHVAAKLGIADQLVERPKTRPSWPKPRVRARIRCTGCCGRWRAAACSPRRRTAVFR